MNCASGIADLVKILLVLDPRKKIKNDLLIENHINPTLDDIQRACQYFFRAKKYFAEEMYVSDIVQQIFEPSGLKWKKLILGEKSTCIQSEQARQAQSSEKGSDNVDENTSDDDNIKIIDDDEQQRQAVVESSAATTNRTGSSSVEGQIKVEQEEDDGKKWSKDLERFRSLLEVINKENSLIKQTKQTNSNPEIPFTIDDFQTWTERAHNQCVNLVNTLSSAKEVAECLNKIISWLLIGAIFIMWLLLTGLATTKVFVLIASPLLAATFIFGDSCKTLFQGIIYVFVIHPFDVGDLCIIEGEMLEVRSIGVWTITFTKVDKIGTRQERVMHSTSQLISKSIINHKTKFDWSDRVEFDLGPVKEINCEKKNEIIKFFRKYLKHEEKEISLQPNQQDDEENNSKSRQEVNASKAGEIEGKTHSEPGDRKEQVMNDSNPHEKRENKEGGKSNNGVDSYKIKRALLKEKNWRSSLTRSPNLSVLAKEDSVTLLIRLEYNAGDTDKWTYSECLCRRDDLRGEFHLHVQDVVAMFKIKFGKSGIKEAHSSAQGDLVGTS